MTALVTRKPTGVPAWPILLLAGVEKSGKSYAAAQASASELVDRTLWITCGEDDPDELGQLPGARFEIVQQDGTHRAICDTLAAIHQLPTPTGKPHLIVIDSVSMLWQVLKDEAQEAANRRRKRTDADISMDLWNQAANRWRHLMDLLRAHRGPVLLTARLAQVAEVDGNRPTGRQEWRVEGHKTLPFDVSGIVQLRSRSERFLTGVRSLRFDMGADDLLPIPAETTVHDLWVRYGLDQSGERTHRSADGAASLAADQQARDALLDRLAAVADMGRMAAWWSDTHGHDIALTPLIDQLRALVEQGEARHRQAQTPPAEQLVVEQLDAQPITDEGNPT